MFRQNYSLWLMTLNADLVTLILIKAYGSRGSILCVPFNVSHTVFVSKTLNDF